MPKTSLTLLIALVLCLISCSSLPKEVCMIDGEKFLCSNHVEKTIKELDGFMCIDKDTLEDLMSK
jgi:hypothetical protein